MLINRALKLRIYPTPEQEILINKTIGSCRFLYNQMLDEHIKAYEKLKDDRKSLFEYKYKTEAQYKTEFEFLKEVDSIALQQAKRNLSSAYQNFFNSLKGKRKGEKVGYPKFKSKKFGQQAYRTVGKVLDIDFSYNQIKLPKIGFVNFRHKDIKEWYKSAKVKSATVSKSRSGKYFVSLNFEGEQDFKGYQDFNNPKVIGLDMSLGQFYVDQFGNSPNFVNFYKKNEKKLAKFQRKLSRKTNGSKNKDKARLKVAKLSEKILNQRSDFTHKLSKSLVDNHDVIVVETLSLKAMSQGLKLGKSVMSLGYSEFIRQLRYKSLWNDKTLIQADKWFASSKTCNVCGHINKNLLLQEREWVCPKCDTHHNRDQNAGQNLYNYGLNLLGVPSSEFKPVESKTSGIGSLVLSLDVEAGKVDNFFN